MKTSCQNTHIIGQLNFLEKSTRPNMNTSVETARLMLPIWTDQQQNQGQVYHRYVGCPVSWSSKMQIETTLSTTEAELIALSKGLSNGKTSNEPTKRDVKTGSWNDKQHGWSEL